MNRWLIPLLLVGLVSTIALFAWFSPSSLPLPTAKPQDDLALPSSVLTTIPLPTAIRITHSALTPAVASNTCSVAVPTNPGAERPDKLTNTVVSKTTPTPSYEAGSTLSTPKAFALAVAELINRQRQYYGLAPLAIIATLNNAAYHHSLDMSTQPAPLHQGSDGSTGGGRMLAAGYQWERWSEIIGWGFADPTTMVEWWLGHNEHRNILLSSAFTEVGVGYASLGNTPWQNYWTVNLGRPLVNWVDNTQFTSSTPTSTPLPNLLPPFNTMPNLAPSVAYFSDHAVGDQQPITQSISCASASPRSYSLIPMEGADLSHPAPEHADLNLAQRGYTSVAAEAQFLDIAGPVDADAPQFSGLFAESQPVYLTAFYQVYDWDWACSEHGCRSQSLTTPDVTMVGLSTKPGALLRAPTRHGSVYGDSYVATVLYAEKHRLTLAYTRDGSVANGYAVHIEQVCVDPNLVQLYQAANSAGRQQLPALQHNQIFGTALNSEVRVVIRDRGTFLDPRSRKDWWRGF